jgi:hypothetical protein
MLVAPTNALSTLDGVDQLRVLVLAT